MTARERILNITLAQKIEANREYAARIGLKVEQVKETI